MATWGNATFDNDPAVAWVVELVGGGGLRLVRATFEQAADAMIEGELDAALGARALAAAEVVAALLGRPHPALPGPVLRWAAGRPPPPSALVTRAVGAVGCVLGVHSELRQQWANSPEAAAWYASVEALRGRLTSR